MIYTIINYNDSTISQAGSLHSILSAALCSTSFGHKLSKMTMYVLEGESNSLTSINKVVTYGKIVDLGEYIACYQIFLSVIRERAKKPNPKGDLVFLKEKFIQYYL